MIRLDESALICDFAEVYHIYEYKELPPAKAAIYAVGLPNDSRIKMKLSGRKYSTDTLLLAAVCDRLSVLIWQKTKDGQKGQNKPQSILEGMLAGDKTSELMAFDSADAYEAARAKIMGK